MKHRLTLLQQALILIAVPLAFELGLLMTLYWFLQQAEAQTERAEQAKRIISQTDHLIQTLFDVGFAYISYDAMTKPFFEKRFNDLVAKVPREFGELRQAVKHNSHYVKIVDTVQVDIQRAMRTLIASKKEVDEGGRLNIYEALKLREDLNYSVAQLERMTQQERAAQVDPQAAARTKLLVFRLIILGVVVSILIALFLAWLFHTSTSKRLNTLLDNSVKLGKREPLATRLEGDDEIAELDRAYHEAAHALSEFARKERAVIEYAVDVICSLDEAGSFTAVSPASIQLWAFKPDELIGKQWTVVLPPEEIERCLGWAKSAKEAHAAVSLETRVRRADGGIIEMLWSGYWSDKEQSMFCVAHDITERKQLERFRQEFAAMISHDLRTPLSAVQSTLAILGKGAWGTLNEKGVSKVETAQSNITRSIELINNLLDLEKMETGKLELRLEQTDLREVLKRSRDTVAMLSERKGIDIQLAETDLQITADSGRLCQVLINLLGNAIKFSPDSSVIRVTIDEKPETIRVNVSDEGPGIPDEYINSIFERYQQIPSDSAASKEGSGLGLAICKAFIEAHRGTIGVASKPGSGSTFWFEIPKAGVHGAAGS